MTSQRGGIACAIDVHDYEPSVVDLAGILARQFQTHVDLIYVTPYPDSAAKAWPGYIGSPQALIEDNRLFQAVAIDSPDVPILRHHLSGHPHDQILSFVSDQRSRLLVMGSRGRRGLSRWVLGSVAETLLRKASCPVMIVGQKAAGSLETNDHRVDR